MSSYATHHPVAPRDGRPLDWRHSRTAGCDGVRLYSEEATRKAKSLALRVIAEEIEHGEMTPEADTLQFSVAA